MGRLGVALMVFLSATLMVLASHYVKVTQARDKLHLQLEDAAQVAASHPDTSSEHRAAQNRGRVIISNWPVLWWENGETVRSRITGEFDNFVALKREKPRSTKPAAELSRRR